jgi:CelD/BcsL family acetyltransferase involved in cellulose biosynthesis
MIIDLANPDLLVLVSGAFGIRSAVGIQVSYPVAWRADRGIAVATDRAAFEALEEEWTELDRTAEGSTLFQSFVWCRAVFDHHKRYAKSFAPLVVTLREHGRLVGLLPLKVETSGLARIATGFGEPYQQYSDVLLAPDAPANAAARLLEAACRLPRLDGLNFLKVRDDSALAPLLRARNAIRSNEDAAPFVDLRPYPDFKAYLATLNAKTRKNMRNTKNRLGRSGTLDHRVLTDPADIVALVERAHAGRERWLADQGLTSRAFRDPTFVSFAVAAAGGETPLPVMAMSLTLDGEPIADQWGFVQNGRYYAYVATWLPGHEDASPGKLHLEQVILACHERGIGIADFLMPAARYKFTWTDRAMPVADYALPLSLKARLELSVWSGHLRPFLKRMALKLPTEVRGKLARVFLRR